MTGHSTDGTREKDTVRPDGQELCAFSSKYGEHVPVLAVVISRDTDGARRIACVPQCPKPAAQPTENGTPA